MAAEFVINLIPCGSELARDGVCTFNINVTDIPLSSDRRPEQARSHIGPLVAAEFVINLILCGSELAREGVCTFNINVTDIPLSSDRRPEQARSHIESRVAAEFVVNLDPDQCLVLRRSQAG